MPIPSAYSSPNALFFAAASLLLTVVSDAFHSITLGQETPRAALNLRIDQLAQVREPALLAPPADDPQFIRRLSLDLRNTVPTSDEIREFLQDPAPDKRARWIERMMGDPLFDERIVTWLDLTLMERRNAQHVPRQNWIDWLRLRVEQGTTLDHLTRDLIQSPWWSKEARTEQRFFLDRGGDPNLITRDFGRIFLGRDLQCAQCHDHPLIEDYRQRDYQGMLAFFAPSQLVEVTYKDPEGKDAKMQVYAEKAASDGPFESVFAKGKSHWVGPTLLDRSTDWESYAQPSQRYTGPAIDWAVGDPPKKPAHSRRERLAQELLVSSYPNFAENWANRLWALMFGTGLVQPLDMHHANNPASNPELLKALTEELVAAHFDYRPILREIALSQAYQRSHWLAAETQPESLASLNIESITAQIDPLKIALEKCIESAEQAETQWDTAIDAFTATENEHVRLRGELSKVDASLVDSAKKLNELTTAHAAASKPLEDARQRHLLLTEAHAKLEQAKSLSPGEDAEWSQAIAVALQRRDAAAAQIPNLEAALASATTNLEAQRVVDRGLQEQSATWVAAIDGLRPAIESQSQAIHTARSAWRELERQRTTIERQMAQWERILQWKQKKDAAQADATELAQQQAQSHFQQVVDDQSRSILVSPLRPLSAEQLCWSTMRVMGIFDQYVANAKAEIDKSQPLATDMPVDDQVHRNRNRLAVRKAIDALRGNADQFASLFAAGAGQADTYFASAEQALFMGNGGSIYAWAGPSGNNVTLRVAQNPDRDAAIEDLYQSLLCRKPTDSERELFKSHFQVPPEQMMARSQEAVWAILTSVEFRFVH